LRASRYFPEAYEADVHHRQGTRRDISHFIDFFQLMLAGPAPYSRNISGLRTMTISSVSAPASAAPINPVDTSAPKPTAATASADSSETTATHQPPPPPPLPPGQGTRVDQLA
jgi:hypothetical protein